MSALSEYVKTIIGVSLLSGIISVTAPSGSNNKTFRFISGMFVLLCLILPLKDIILNSRDFSLNLNLNNTQYSFSDTAEYAKELTENKMKSEINACVKQVTGESALDISITVNGNEEKIEITEVSITIDKAYAPKAQALKEYVFSKFGITPTVII